MTSRQRTLDLMYFWILLSVVVQVAAQAKIEEADFCLKDEAILTCQQFEVILIDVATFGRMSSQSRCVGTPENIGCQTDTTSHVRDRCLGKRNCSFKVSDFLHIAEPCSGDYTSYMSLRYHCEKVLWIDKANCHAPQLHMIKTNTGYISYSSAMTPNRPSRDCPWSLSVTKTQTITFSMVTSHRNDDSHSCSHVMMFTEVNSRRDVDMCSSSSSATSGFGQRDVIYNSTSNEVTFYVENKRYEQEYDYLIKYTVVGCPELQTPLGGWVRQDATVAQVQCNKTKEIWYLTCQRNTWRGDFTNCSQGALRSSDEQTTIDAHAPYSIRLVLAILLGIVIGVMTGLTLLTLVYFCYKKKSKHEYEQAEVPLDYFTECQQKQIYASMLRDDIRHKCGTYSDPLHQTESMLPCAHTDLIAHTLSSCPAHPQQIITSPYPIRSAMTSYNKAPVSSSCEQTIIQHSVPAASFPQTTDSCVQQQPNFL